MLTYASWTWAYLPFHIKIIEITDWHTHTQIPNLQHPKKAIITYAHLSEFSEINKQTNNYLLTLVQERQTRGFRFFPINHYRCAELAISNLKIPALSASKLSVQRPFQQIVSPWNHWPRQCWARRVPLATSPARCRLQCAALWVWASAWLAAGKQGLARRCRWLQQ